MIMKKMFFACLFVGLLPCLLHALPPPAYVLTATKSGSGTGTVTSNGSLNCGTACTIPYTVGGTITLSVTADPGSHFVEWTGACTGETLPCPLLMDSDKIVDAKFDCDNGTTNPLDGLCGLNGRGDRYEQCDLGVWVEYCDDPDECVSGYQECDGNNNFALCEKQGDGNYGWTVTICDDVNLCTDDSCDEQSGCVYQLIDCDDANECTNDSCDPILRCQNEPLGKFLPCGDQTYTECSGPDFCDGNGFCTPNNEPGTTTCGDAGTECVNQDFCSGAGDCTDNGFVAEFTSCGDAGGECINQDTCDGIGGCTDNGFVAEFTPCGDNTETVCNKLDSCDGAGNCDPRYEPETTPCRDRAENELCDAIEYCDGAGGPCPEDKILTESDICRPSIGTCDADEYCDGSSKTCPDENYTTTNGISCEDIYDYTDNETCATGECLGTEVIGSCGDAYAATTFPYVLESTTIGRPSHIDTYGANCAATNAPLGDAVVHVDMQGGVEYTISIVRHGGWTGFIAIIPICSSFYTNATCLNTGGDADSFTYTPLLGGNATLVVESLSGTGDFTLTIEEYEEPQPDTILTDDDILTDEIVTDEIVTDEIVTDEIVTDEIVTDEIVTDEIVTDEIVTDDGTVITDDGSPLVDDTVTPDDAAPTDKDTTVTDNNTDTDNAVTDNETPDEADDTMIGGEDNLTPGDDTDEPADEGCGCTVVF